MDYRNGFFDQNAERYTLEKRVYRLINALAGSYMYYSTVHTGGFEKAEGNMSHHELANAVWQPFDGEEQVWGKPYGNGWFRQSFVIPPEMDGKTVLYMVKPVKNALWYCGGPQILAYVNGVPTTGMDSNHQQILIADRAKAGQEYTVELCGFFDSINYEGRVGINMQIAALNTGVRALFYDLMAPFGATINMDVDDINRMDILNYLNQALSLVDFRLPAGAEFDATVDQARDYLEKEFYQKACKEHPVLVTAVGHTHIDTGYMWGYEITQKKVCRSYATVLKLMEEYPEYTFIASQPQLYKYLKEGAPELYERVKQRVREGRWQAEGGMWIESDTNMPSGESLVRQFLYGKKFFKDEFGKDNKILWLPDAFGFTAALPQIIKKCGVDYFMTTKLGSNEYDKMPFDTFNWRGIDGTEVLTHFVCGVDSIEDLDKGFFTSYNAHITANYMLGSWNRYQQKDLNRNILMAYGHGDGGGGPTFAMLEYSKRIKRGIPGCPQVETGNALDFFKRLDKDVSGNKRLPVWAGELYMENHQGTFTSVAKIKKNNRKSEVLLQDAELFSIMRQTVEKAEYPRDGFEDAWRMVLTNQFHDILTGASIQMVFDENQGHYDQVNDFCQKQIDGAFKALTPNINLSQNSLVVFNSTSFVRDDIIEFATDLKDFAVLDGDASLPVQKTTEGKYVFFAKGIPAKGYKAFTLARGAAGGQSMAAINDKTVETDEFKVVFDKSGNIGSLFSKKMNREIVQNGAAMNRLVAFEEIAADAWNIKPFFEEKTWYIDQLDGFEVLENGPVRCVVRLTRHFSKSAICQDLIFVKGLDRIDVKNRIDWKDSQILLKADFPFPVNTTSATFDIQFGSIERTTTENTSWDFAKYEVCAHRWADLSEAGFGLSILNDCKYGYDAKKGHLRISLLRSPVEPDPIADQCIHEFTYSIYPHADSWKQADTVRQAAFLNCPAYVCEEPAHTGALPQEFSLVSCPAKNVIVDTVKQAEDGKNTVLRIYENNNRTTDTVLEFASPVKAAWICNMLEEVEAPAEVRDGKLVVHIKPFEVLTFRIEE